MHLTQSIFRSYSALCICAALIAISLSPVAAAQPTPKQDSPQTETNPIVLSVQASGLSTPEQLARAIQLMLDISRDDLAVEYIGQLNQLSIDDAGCYALMRDYGSAFVMRMAMYGGVQPVGRELAEKILSAANRYANDPVRLEELTRHVADSQIAVRTDALENLQALGEVGAAALLNALADETRAADQGLLFEALRRCGPAAEQPILGGILSANPRLRQASVRAAKHLNSDEAVTALLRPALAEDVVPEIRAVASESLQHLLGFIPDVVHADDILSRSVQRRLLNKPQRGDQFLTSQRIWRTHPGNMRLVELKRPQLIVQRIEAAERAEDLIKTSPNSAANLRLYTTAILEATKYVRGFDINVGASDEMNFARQAGPEFVEQVLVEALRRDLIGAAAGACEILGQIGDQKLLSGASVRPLVQAASHTDRRVQFAACEAIMAINPVATFPGSSAVAEAIVSLSQSRGQPKVLVGHHDLADAQNLAAIVKMLGFDSEAVHTAHDLLQRAAEDPDVEYLLLADTLGAPMSQDLVEHLRTHPRTNRLPIGLQFRTDVIDVAWRAGAARAIVDVYLVVDTRQFENYDQWLRRMRSLAGLKMPLLLIVKPGDTDIAAGWAARDADVRFVEIEGRQTAVWKGLPEQVANAFRLSRSPVTLVIEPRTVSSTEVDVSALLVLDPNQWVLWPKWTKQLHDNLVTNQIDVVRTSDTGLERSTASEGLIDQSAGGSVIKIDDIDFLYSRVSDLLSNEDSLIETYTDPTAGNRARRIESDDPLTVAMPWTLDRILVARQMDRLTQISPSIPVSGSQRRFFAGQAMEWLSQISKSPERYPFWDLSQFDQSIGQVANTPQLSASTCQTLGNLGTPHAQQQLADVASQHQLPLEIRQAAVAALQHAFERHGILLTTEQIRLQYDRYNTSESLPEDTRQVLSSVLDAIEKPSGGSSW